LKSINCKFREGLVVLVSRPIAFTFPLSYAYLAGYLINRGEPVKVLFKHHDHNRLVNDIMSQKPLLVGFGSLYPELKEIRHIIDLLNRAGRQFPIVIGGQMVTPTPEFAVSITGADFGVVGEGEIVLYQLVKALREGTDPSQIRGLVIRQGPDLLATGAGEVIEDLKDLPPIPFDLFPQEEWLPIGRWYAANLPQPHWRFDDRVISIHGGRGCPFRCNFCYHHSRPRYRPVDLMIAEGVEALERYNATILYFSDDLVLSTPKRARQLVEALRSLAKPLEYSVSARFDILARMNDDLLANLKDTGCRIMGLGIESGSDRILKLIGKHCTADMILTGLERLKKAGILPSVSIMVGQYTETRDDVEASIRLMQESVRTNPNIQYNFTITTPFPGSQLYDLIFQKGYLKDDREFYEKYFSTPHEWKQVVNLSEMDDAEVIQMHKKIFKLYWKEKMRALGAGVFLVGGAQIALGKLNGRLLARVRPKSVPNGFSRRIHRQIDAAYNSTLGLLDHYRLRLQGICDKE
jgi:anaerobic magnesium-protoporphyrin IX monomethyl ester cyclase